MLAALTFSLIISQLPKGYQTEHLLGWTLVIEKAARQDALWQPAKTELSNHLYRITRVVPDAPLSELKKVPIWIHLENKNTTCMAFHPDKGWLVEHGLPKEMEKSIEIGSLKNFLSWTYEQPWMVLHELAHSYHDRVLEKGFENEDVAKGFDHAKASRLYEKVLHWNGSTAKHYALTNPMEYFAESTEAYFGQNDFYPFVNAELKTADPETFALMERIWGKPQKRP